MFDTELNSGFIGENNINIANHFTDIQLIHPSRNGYSEVYKAKRFGKWHTLKRITDKEKDNVRYQNLLEKEFEIAIQFSHPNIVQTISLEEIPDLGTCIVQEFIDGLTLDEFLAKIHPNKQQTKTLLYEICDAWNTFTPIRLSTATSSPTIFSSRATATMRNSLISAWPTQAATTS